MAQGSLAIENNFTAGLKTEFTGLNFPEHSATDADNCRFTHTGDVVRRLGFDYEENYTLSAITVASKAISSYKWTNAGGSGSVTILVTQVGNILYFWKYSAATVASPISTKKLAGTIDISTYKVTGSSLTTSDIECQFADGNGYLFVFHPSCEPFYISYVPATDALSANAIALQIRDFSGAVDNLDVTTRPATLSAAHSYNLTNQGWVTQPTWSGTDNTSTITYGTGAKSFTVATGLTVTVGQQINVYTTGWGYPTVPAMTGVLTSYNSGTGAMVVTSSYVHPFVSGITQTGGTPGPKGALIVFTITPFNTGYVGDFFTSQGLYPSNADVWWYFKNSSDTFDPTTMVPKVTQNSGYAPKGHTILSAFSQNRTGVTLVTTNYRPRIGTWFQGRAWYAGVDDSFAATADINQMNWSETIYFSQTVTDPSQLGMCYQVNDPTSETLFSLLPTDGGTIQIQGCGAIYKLFPIQNGLLVFAANGIWFITGSQGIGFTANDYTITKISNVESISSTSFVNVQGLPMFWNEDDIYMLSPAQQGLGLTVEPLTWNTIGSFYAAIPKSSKRYVRGDYNPIEYNIQWVYRDTDATTVTERYEFNKILNLNIQTKAFFYFTVSGDPKIHDVSYIPGIGGVDSPEPVFKYFTSNGTNVTFSEEWNEDYVDWATADETNYTSYFVTGYSLRGGSVRKFQPSYIYMYSRCEDANAYNIQGIWDFASSELSNRYSTVQRINNNMSRFGMLMRRHKIRGHGLSLQIKVSSVAGMPFDIMGWSGTDVVNSGD